MHICVPNISIPTNFKNNFYFYVTSIDCYQIPVHFILIVLPNSSFCVCVLQTFHLYTTRVPAIELYQGNRE